ncbi:MAG: oxidoreductase [Jatrophihabitantaceae bacterium]
MGNVRRLGFGVVTADPLAALLELPGVTDSVSRTRASVDALIGNRTLRRSSADVSAESSLRGAWASAWLAGAEHPLEDVRSGAAADDPVVQGALRVQAAIPTLTDTWTRAPRQALARLHALAAADLVSDPEALGRPAPGAAQRLDILAAVLATTSAPAIVVAAIVHGELLSLDAFAPASGVVARVAVRLTLIERGLDPKSLVVIEAGHRELGSAYEAALTGYRNGTPDGLAAWIAHCADAVVAGALESTAICEAIARG